MVTLRHLAIRTQDTDRLATFYKEVFGMKELHRPRGKDGPVYLTDGYFNLALLPNDQQQAPNGLYHFGFLVDDTEQIVEKIKKNNLSRAPKPRPKGRPYAERRASDPDGNFFDISEHGFLDVRPVGGKN